MLKWELGSSCGSFVEILKYEKQAHRKKIVEKQKKRDLIGCKVTLQSIIDDNSANKRNSDCHLQTMIDQHEKVFQTTLYTKTEIQSLCKAYGLVYRKNDSKAKLSERLIAAIKQSTYIPCHLALCDTHQEPSTPALTINNDDQHVQTPLQGTVHETIGHRYAFHAVFV